MNSLAVAVIGLVCLGLGYRLYGNLIERLWDIDPARKTPAHEVNDGVDYVPAKHWTVLFGHHFASIAGAGPILGPVIACLYWGWLGVLLWLVIGSVFLGAVHDFSALVTSVRMKGNSIAHVCRDLMGRRANVLFSVFLWLSLVLVVAVFTAVGAKTLYSKPETAVPAMAIIPLAMLMGFMLYRTSVSQLAVTIAGILFLAAFIILGKVFPVSLPERAWIIILLAYAFFASILPVNILLQPRDYLSTFLLFFGLVTGYLGVIITRLPMNAPAFVGFHSGSGPLFPMMFVIVACGAISGFHSVVSSGTTAKQISSEKDMKRIGFGGMILEGALALLALISVAAGLKWAGASGLVYPELMKKGWIVAFSEGFGQITLPIFGIFGSLVAATVLNAFIITTLDTATRITRYITEELFGIKNMFLATIMVIAPAYYLAIGNWGKIWPVFGASNQLVAALALGVVSLYLLSAGKKTAYTAVPGAIMLVTSSAALAWELNNFLRDRNYLLSVIAGLLLVLALYMTVITVRIFIDRRKKQQHRPG
ncbi:MAG: carbon starvation protein A [Elusimicrobia bacterium]|nr:carbon starvation protein A [Elusimicrobiota bacterium]